MDLAEAISQVKARLRSAAPLEGQVPGRVSVFLRPIRKGPEGEESTGLLKRLLFSVASADDLYDQLAENVLLYTLGEEETPFREIPNIELRLLGRRATVPMPGAPPLDQQEQLWLKVTVYEYSPSLWDQLFGKK